MCVCYVRVFDFCLFVCFLLFPCFVLVFVFIFNFVYLFVCFWFAYLFQSMWKITDGIRRSFYLIPLFACLFCFVLLLKYLQTVM